MGLRPVPATWFEVLVPRREVGRAVDTLAGTGHVQIEAETEASPDAELPELPCPPSPRNTRHFVFVTGWTDDETGDGLRGALERDGVCALVRIDTPPEDKHPPIVLDNPWWARPFETMSRLLGVPAPGEVDPSMVLTVVAPLLFGYMFGDVGHGAVLLLVGIVLRNRVPALRMLVLGGLSSMAFGWVFGSVFTREDLIAPLWTHPMQAPLSLLVVSLAGGAVILLLGLVLGGIQAVWQRRTTEWLLSEAALVPIYVGLLLMVLDLRAGALAAAGLLWWIVGNGLAAKRRRLVAALASVGELAERLLQIGVNTLSFVRVGAFALAHAGLSSAVYQVGEAAGSPVGQWIVLALGNALIVVIEGLVVSIQTTRLVLFEFFARFLVAEGRAFVAMETPPEASADPEGPPADGSDEDDGRRGRAGGRVAETRP